MPKTSSRSNLPKKNGVTARRDVRGQSTGESRPHPRLVSVFKFPFFPPRHPVIMTFFSFHLENLMLGQPPSPAEGFFAEVIFSVLQFYIPINEVEGNYPTFSGQLNFNHLVGVSAGNNNSEFPPFEYNGSVFAFCNQDSSGVLQQENPTSVTIGPNPIANVTVTDGVASVDTLSLDFMLQGGGGNNCQVATASVGAQGFFWPAGQLSSSVDGDWAPKSTWTTPATWWPYAGSDYPSLQNPPGGNPVCGEFPM
jgi:hypothetical protein